MDVEYAEPSNGVGPMTVDLATSFLIAAVGLGIPLALAALGETISERGGMINIGLEGSIVAGALGGAMGALAWGPYVGLGTGVLSGLIPAAVFALFAVYLNTDQIITGTALTVGGLGFTGAVFQSRFGATGIALELETVPSVSIPLLQRIPIIGPAFFDQALTAYLTYGLAVVLTWWLFKSRSGLRLRAVGEAPDAAANAGINVKRYRAGAVLVGGALAGLAGAHLSLVHTGTFQEGMSAGKGFIAIAVVVLGRWNPAGVVAAALFFGAAEALQFSLQALDLDLPYPLLLALPYVLSLAALAGWIGRSRAPAALALPWPRTNGDS